MDNGSPERPAPDMNQVTIHKCERCGAGYIVDWMNEQMHGPMLAREVDELVAKLNEQENDHG